ncbi:MAG: hypothetical protein ACI9F2_000422 [Lysobacterales bacterium]|jgi:hypothetical protein
MSDDEISLRDTVNKKLEEGAKELQLPTDVYKEVVVSSLDQTTNDLVALNKAIESGNFDDIQLISHRLKGTYANLRFDYLANGAGEMNDLSKKAEGLDRISECYTKFKNDYESFAAILKEKNNQDF